MNSNQTMHGARLLLLLLGVAVCALGSLAPVVSARPAPVRRGPLNGGCHKFDTISGIAIRLSHLTDGVNP